MDLPERPRILVIRLSALGDVVFAMHAVSRLRRERPDAHLTWLIEDRFAGLLDVYRDVDDVVVFERKDLSRRVRRPHTALSAVTRAIRLLRDLRRRRFDAVLDFQGNLKSAVFSLATRSPRRIGFARGACREGNHLASTVRVTAPDDPHRLVKDLALLGPLGLDATPARPRLVPGPGAEASVAAFLAGPDGERPFAVLHPGTSRFGDFKRWPAEQFAELGRHLATELDLEGIVTFGPGEEDLARQVVAMAGGGARLALRTRSLAEVIALLARARLYVGADTGITHLASALEVPTVALYGPKDPAVYAPAGDHVRVVTHDIECRPCGERSCPLGHVRCMRDLAVAPVLARARELLVPA